MRCPVDGNELRSGYYEADVEVDQCSKCEGIWLEKGELERIQEVVLHDYRGELAQIPEDARKAYQAARQKRDPLKCPACQSEMTEREHGYCSQIFIDVCRKCQGVWLDKGELQALEVFFERSKADTRELRKGFWRSLHDLVFHGIVPD
jgi:Zn-finger nucleic acid-binding protein